MKAFLFVTGDSETDLQFHCGQEVKVIGVSPRRGFLVVQGNNTIHHVPYSLLDLKVTYLS